MYEQNDKQSRSRVTKEHAFVFEVIRHSGLPDRLEKEWNFTLAFRPIHVTIEALFKLHR
jgi:hypothetical protein